MKPQPKNAFATGLCLLLMICLSCQDTQDLAPVTPPPPAKTPPPVLNAKIFKSAYPAANATLAIKDSVVVSFNEVSRRVKTIDNSKYRAIVDEVILVGVPTSATWAGDSLSVTLRPPDMLKENTSFQISIKTHWESRDNSNTWSVVEWEGNQLRENLTVNFTTLQAEIKIASDNIEYLYPIPNQYHFLVEEYPFCFVQLKRGQESLFSLSGYSYVAQFIDFNGVSVETAVSYDKDKRQIAFDAPTSLQPETIYALNVVARSGSSAETVLIAYHFRTSKYKTFAEKFNTLTFGLSASYAGFDNPYDESIFSRITGIGEFFDSFELEKKNAELSSPKGIYSVSYLGGLVRLEAVLPGTDWYDQHIYPLMFAPWTQPSFKPFPKRDTTVISFPPVEAMYFSDCGTGTLTVDMIASNNAPAIAGGTTPEILWHLELALYEDFNQIQTQVVTTYSNSTAPGDREIRVMTSVFPRYTAGNYKYKVNYTLPSGEVTTTISGSILY